MLFHEFDLLPAEGNLVPLESCLSSHLKQLFIQSLVFVFLVLHVSLKRLVVSINLRVHFILDILYLGHQVVHHGVNIIAEHANVTFVQG